MAVRVKICGLTRIDDVAAAARAGADAVGFVLWPGSPRAVTVERAAELGRALPPWTARVGVFVSVSVDAVRAAVQVAGLSAVQLHGLTEAAPYLALPVPVLWSVPLRDGGAGADRPGRDHADDRRLRSAPARRDRPAGGLAAGGGDCRRVSRSCWPAA